MSSWALSWHGLRTVVELEIKQRVRSNRWVWALIGWFVLVGGLTTLVIWSTTYLYDHSLDNPHPLASAGPMAFGLITYLVLGLGLMIAPAFTSTSINGDRNAGTLATLQATRLTAVEIALGKLVAAWLVAAVFLVVVLPFIGWAMVLGSISFWQVLVTFAVVFAEVAVVCAIGLGFSALISRAAISTMLTYLMVVILSVISVIVVGLSTVLLQHDQEVRVWGLPQAVEDDYQNRLEKAMEKPDGVVPLPPIDKCTWYTRVDTVTRLDQTWWIVVANPFVVAADAAPLPPGAAANLSNYVSWSGDPLAAVRTVVRWMSTQPELEVDDCSRLFNSLANFTTTADEYGNVTVTDSHGRVVNSSPVKRHPLTADTAIWPWGLGSHIVLGGLFFWIAVRRLRVPAGVLPRGTRVA